MRATAFLTFFVGLTLRLFAQGLDTPRPQAQCKFSDGNVVRVRSIPEGKTYALITDEDLLTVAGLSVPAGHYTVLPAQDPHNGSWKLKMRNETAKGEFRELPPLPMSVIGSAGLRQLEPSGFSEGSFTVSFDHTGGSCMMHWRPNKLSIVLSLEFTEKNTDLPVEQ